MRGKSEIQLGDMRRMSKSENSLIYPIAVTVRDRVTALVVERA